MNQKLVARWCIYLAGLVFLAMGIMLNTKTGFGVSAVVSAQYSVSVLFGWNFGNVTMVFYIIYPLITMLLKGKNARAYDLMQIVFGFFFTRMLNILGAMLPTPATVPGRVIVLVLAIVSTGIGAAASLDMRLVPNPADGLVQAISDFTGKEMGFCKNAFDFGCMAFALAAGLIVNHSVMGVGVGIGTLASMLGIGRVIAWFNGHFKAKLLEIAGLQK